LKKIRASAFKLDPGPEEESEVLSDFAIADVRAERYESRPPRRTTTNSRRTEIDGIRVATDFELNSLERALEINGTRERV